MNILLFKINNEVKNLNNLSKFESLILKNIISSIFYFGNDIERFGYEKIEFQEELLIEFNFSLNNDKYILKDLFSSKTKFYNKKYIKELSKKIEFNNNSLINKTTYINHSLLLKNVICYYSMKDFNEYSNLLNENDKKFQKESLFRGFIYFNCLNNKNKFMVLKLLINNFYNSWFELKYIKKINNDVMNYYDNFFELVFNISNDFGYKLSINYSTSIDFYELNNSKEINLDTNLLNNRTYLLILDILFKSFKILDKDFNINNLNPLLIIENNNLINEELIKKYIPQIQIIKEDPNV